MPQSISKQFEQLNSVMTENGQRRLRELMSSAQGPAIPYLGCYMSDMLSIQDGNSELDSANADGSEVLFFIGGKSGRSLP